MPPERTSADPGTVFDFECPKCSATGTVEIDDDLDNHLVKCAACRNECLDVWCEACQMGGYFVADASQHPDKWRCERCGNEYPVPASTYRHAFVAKVRRARRKSRAMGKAVGMAPIGEIPSGTWQFCGHDPLGLAKMVGVVALAVAVSFIWGFNAASHLDRGSFYMLFGLAWMAGPIAVWGFLPSHVNLDAEGIAQFRRHFAFGLRRAFVPWESVTGAAFYREDADLGPGAPGGGYKPVVVLRHNGGLIAFFTGSLWLKPDLPDRDIDPGVKFLREQLDRRGISLEETNWLMAAQGIF